MKPIYLSTESVFFQCRARIKRNYCLDCEWSASIEDYDRHELAALAVEHATGQGHDVDSDVVRRERESNRESRDDRSG